MACIYYYITPNFSVSHLKGLIPNFSKSVDLFLSKLAPLADGKTKVPLKRYMRDSAVDVISEVRDRNIQLT